MVTHQTTWFLKAAPDAFPCAVRESAAEAANVLHPYIDASYRAATLAVWVPGGTVHIPRRLHFAGWENASLGLAHPSSLAVQCLCTRSTDGYARQAALRVVMGSSEPWVIPFIVLLAGEYVLEIANDLIAALPALERGAYARFVGENRPLMRDLRAKATSYWNCYHRAAFPHRGAYPGLVFLHELEHWAA